MDQKDSISDNPLLWSLYTPKPPSQPSHLLPSPCTNSTTNSTTISTTTTIQMQIKHPRLRKPRKTSKISINHGFAEVPSLPELISFYRQQRQISDRISERRKQQLDIQSLPEQQTQKTTITKQKLQRQPSQIQLESVVNDGSFVGIAPFFTPQPPKKQFNGDRSSLSFQRIH